MKPKSILVTAPSGAGKTTLVRKLLEEKGCFEFSISATTREPRNNETDGKDYYFISDALFQSYVVQGKFLEWEEVYQGTKYGTLLSEVNKIQSKGKIPLFDIDINGAMKIKKILGENVYSFFIAPPDFGVLETRLRTRNTETEEKIQIRLQKAISEMKFANIFDKKIINNNIDTAYAQFRDCVCQFIYKS